MSEIITVGLDLAKNVFQVHGADASGRAVLRKKLRRDQVLDFFSRLPPCVVAMEACGGAHFWGREIGKLGHEVRLIPPAYVKPFVKRQKNDAADAEAICEAALRPTMRFVPVKSEETQGAALVFRIRELLVRQRTQAINALRGLPGEFGQVVPQGAANAARLIAIVEDPDSDLPADAIATLTVLVAALSHLEAEIGKLDAQIERRAKQNEVARRLMTVPGIGSLIATALAARDVPQGPGFCGLARPDAAAALDRRQAAARHHDQDGGAIGGRRFPGPNFQPTPSLGDDAATPQSRAGGSTHGRCEGAGPHQASTQMRQIEREMYNVSARTNNSIRLGELVNVE